MLATRRGHPTPNAAIFYNIDKQLGIYASYATSYSLPAGDVEDKQGETGNFDPVQGVNHEVGVKYDIPSLSASFSSARFMTEIQNGMVATTGTDSSNLNKFGRNYSYQVNGEGRQSQGLEVSGEIGPLRNWRLSGGATYRM